MGTTNDNTPLDFQALGVPTDDINLFWMDHIVNFVIYMQTLFVEVVVVWCFWNENKGRHQSNVTAKDGMES